MPVPLRQALALLALPVALLLHAFASPHPDAASEASPGAVRPKPFAGSVVARAPAAPQYAESSGTRARQLIAGMNAMWRDAFTSAGERYADPGVELREQQSGGACDMPGDWAGLYCGRHRRIVIDLGDHHLRHAAIGGGLSDDLLGYTLAHEIGHHVQMLRENPDTSSRRELHAQCLAGVWGRASGRALPPAWSYAADAGHGTVEQQIHWLNVGYRHARPADCDALWPAPSADRSPHRRSTSLP